MCFVLVPPISAPRIRLTLTGVDRVIRRHSPASVERLSGRIDLITEEITNGVLEWIDLSNFPKRLIRQALTLETLIRVDELTVPKQSIIRKCVSVCDSDDLLEFLSDSGVLPPNPSHDKTFLYDCITHDSIRLTRRLLEMRSDLGMAAWKFLILMAVDSGSVNCLDGILRLSGIELRGDREILKVAVESDKPRMVGRLIQLGCSADARTFAHVKSVACFDVIINSGIDPGIVDEEGNNILHSLISDPNPALSLISHAITRGVSVLTVGKNRESPLTKAIRLGMVDTVKLFCESISGEKVKAELERTKTIQSRAMADFLMSIGVTLPDSIEVGSEPTARFDVMGYIMNLAGYSKF